MNIVSMRVLGISFADGDKFKDTLCKIKNEYINDVKHNYKLTLIPVEPSESIVSRREFYTDDMISLIKSGHIKIVV